MLLFLCDTVNYFDRRKKKKRMVKTQKKNYSGMLLLVRKII